MTQDPVEHNKAHHCARKVQPMAHHPGDNMTSERVLTHKTCESDAPEAITVEAKSGYVEGGVPREAFVGSKEVIADPPWSARIPHKLYPPAACSQKIASRSTHTHRPFRQVFTWN
jgi:hypothetical protein